MEADIITSDHAEAPPSDINLYDHDLAYVCTSMWHVNDTPCNVPYSGSGDGVFSQGSNIR